MRSIEARFKKIESKNPFHGASVNLVRAVRGQKFSRSALVKNFKKLMPQDEYAKDETKQLIDFLEEATNEAEEIKIEAYFDHRSLKNPICTT